MSSSHGQYRPLLDEEDEFEDSARSQSYHDEDDGIPLNASKPAGPPPPYSSPRLFAGSRLSKSCIALCVLVLAIFLSIIGGGGLYLYKTELINGQSPPWYPTPLGGTVSSWQESYAKAQKMVDKMSLVEKVNITTGVGWAMGLCVGTLWLPQSWSWAVL